VKTILYATALLGTLTAAACGTSHEAAEPAERAAVPAATDRAAITSLPSTFEAGGVVRARVTAQVASRVMSPVVDVKIHAGDRVRRGDPLVVLDGREMLAHRERAAASVVAAQESASAAEADVAAAEASLQLARATHQRVADLAGKGSATPQELDQARAGLQAAEAQLRAAQARRAAAHAGHDAARAATAAAEAGVGYTVLAAPFAGVVTERSVDPGAMAMPGTPLLTIEDPASFRLEVRLDEARAAQVAPGRQVEVAIGDAAGSVRTWSPATIAEIARLDPASHAFLVKIDLPPGTEVRSGAFGRARFSGPARQTLTVPESAVVRRGQLTFVFTVDAEKRAHLRAVSPGAAAAGRLEVLAGLTDGDPVVVNPPPALVDGGRIEGASALARGDQR
jgi:multidrug efflux pump subunit AcrA (membrane-fusion protein)